VNTLQNKEHYICSKINQKLNLLKW